MQIGEPGDVQSADVEHCGITHAPFWSQIRSDLHAVTPSRPSALHCSAVVQQAFGLCFVQAAKPTSATKIKVRMPGLSAARDDSCLRSTPTRQS
jgi:hypothetical protein